jgi:pimeloyl-ACP methyl ester carboxylesterase
MEESYLKERGIYYRINSFAEDRPTLVFIHGLSGSSSAWLLYEKLFEQKYNILTFDIRGHGKSIKLPQYSDYEIEKFAEDLHALILYTKIPKFILISHSFGSLIALEYIKLYGENVFGNILLAPVSDLSESFSNKVLGFILKIFKIINLLPFKQKKGHHVDYNKYPNSGDWDMKRCYADVSNTTLPVYLNCLRQSLGLPRESALEKIKVPTLIIHGLKDTMVAAKNSLIMCKKIEKSEILLLPKANHIIVLNNFKEVAGAIESFIEKQA